MFSTEGPSAGIEIRFSMSSENAYQGCCCYQNRYSNSPLAITAFGACFFVFSFSFSRSRALWQEANETVAGGEKKRWRDSFLFFSCAPYVVSFGEEGGALLLADVLAHSLCSWCLCTHLALCLDIQTWHSMMLCCLSHARVKWTWKKRKEKEISGEINPWSTLIVSDAAKTWWKLPFFSLPTLTMSCRNRLFSKDLTNLCNNTDNSRLCLYLPPTTAPINAWFEAIYQMFSSVYLFDIIRICPPRIAEWHISIRIASDSMVIF